MNFQLVVGKHKKKCVGKKKKRLFWIKSFRCKIKERKSFVKSIFMIVLCTVYSKKRKCAWKNILVPLFRQL